MPPTTKSSNIIIPSDQPDWLVNIFSSSSAANSQPKSTSTTEEPFKMPDFAGSMHILHNVVCIKSDLHITRQCHVSSENIKY